MQEPAVTSQPLLIIIENRLSSLEDSVKSILDKGDEMNEVTQEKLNIIQVQLEQQAAGMRRMRLKMYNSYSSRAVFFAVVFVLLIFGIIIHSIM
jgi:hypothetical protein